MTAGEEMYGVATIPFVVWYSKQRGQWERRSFRNKKAPCFALVHLCNDLTLPHSHTRVSCGCGLLRKKNMFRLHDVLQSQMCPKLDMSSKSVYKPQYVLDS